MIQIKIWQDKSGPAFVLCRIIRSRNRSCFFFPNYVNPKIVTSDTELCKYAFYSAFIARYMGYIISNISSIPKHLYLKRTIIGHNFWRSSRPYKVDLSVCPSICLFVCPFVCLYDVCIAIRLFVCLMSVTSFWFQDTITPSMQSQH